MTLILEENIFDGRRTVKNQNRKIELSQNVPYRSIRSTPLQQNHICENELSCPILRRVLFFLFQIVYKITIESLLENGCTLTTTTTR